MARRLIRIVERSCAKLLMKPQPSVKSMDQAKIKRRHDYPVMSITTKIPTSFFVLSVFIYQHFSIPQYASTDICPEMTKFLSIARKSKFVRHWKHLICGASPSSWCVTSGILLETQCASRNCTRLSLVFFIVVLIRVLIVA